ncbi:MAG: hypothetical protein ACR2JS_01605 [Candidatus Nanopelagicales bacterium]
MTDRSTPWWFSGDSSAGDAGEGTSSTTPGRSDSGMSLGSLLAGAQQLFDWASELVLAPHADHADPREHPDCLVCKGTALVQGVRSEPSAPRPAREIAWIPLERQGF